MVCILQMGMQMLLLYECSKSYCDNNEGKECVAEKGLQNETKQNISISIVCCSFLEPKLNMP